jgi:hypothetical protein
MQQLLYIDTGMLRAVPLTHAMLVCVVQVLLASAQGHNQHSIISMKSSMAVPVRGRSSGSSKQVGGAATPDTPAVSHAHSSVLQRTCSAYTVLGVSVSMSAIVYTWLSLRGRCSSRQPSKQTETGTTMPAQHIASLWSLCCHHQQSGPNYT